MESYSLMKPRSLIPAAVLLLSACCPSRPGPPSPSVTPLRFLLINDVYFGDTWGRRPAFASRKSGPSRFSLGRSVAAAKDGFDKVIMRHDPRRLLGGWNPMQRHSQQHSHQFIDCVTRTGQLNASVLKIHGPVSVTRSAGWRETGE